MKNGKTENKHQLLVVTCNEQKNRLAAALKRLMNGSKSRSNGNLYALFSSFAVTFSLHERTRNS
jgi:hypothetical protein